MKIIFMGTPEFAVPALKSLIDSEHDVVAVYTQPPKPKNRGLKEEKSPIHILAEENFIPVYTPKNFKKSDDLVLVLDTLCDIIIVAAYGLIIPSSILYSKKFGCINIHPSKLPKYRGASPLQRTIINGDTDSAICIIKMDENVDTGDILMQENFVIPARITLTDYHDLCANLGAKLLLKTLTNIENIIPVKQDSNGASYAKKLSKEEGEINFKFSANKIDCMVRGMNPWPGTYFKYNDDIFKILEITPIDLEGNFFSGEIIDSKNAFIVKCGEGPNSSDGGAIIVEKIQVPGKKPISGIEFLRGYKNIFSEKILY